MSASLFPLFLKLAGKKVVVVGGGRVAAAKVESLRETGARMVVVAPRVGPELASVAVEVRKKEFEPADLEGAWLAIAAATPEVNRAVAAVADERRIHLNAVDDSQCGTAMTGGVVRRGGVTVAVSTSGAAPALAGLIREALEAVLPEEVGRWVEVARELRNRQRRDGVPVERRRPELLEALNRLYGQSESPETVGQLRARPAIRQGPPSSEAPQVDRPRPFLTGSPANAERRSTMHSTLDPRPSTALVSLVGAGPGDPELLTLKAASRLAEADLVLYDALVSPEVLALAPRARRFFVGKRAGRKSIRQETIHRLMIRAARRGERVVRLKCGDPFVLGRGGEESLALAAAGVPFEVVPGVSSAVAAPALAGIPVTHRGLASGFAVVSGHSEEAYGPILDSIAPGSLTLVVLMGLANRSRLARALVHRGWRPDTPAAVCLASSTPRAHTWVGTLVELAQTNPLSRGRERDRVRVDPSAPGTVVIGEVVSLAAAIGRWAAEATAATLSKGAL